MLKNRMREWLMDHPEVLSLLFLVAAKAAEHFPDITTKSGGSAYQGP